MSRPTEPMDVAMGFAVVACGVGMVGATYWYGRVMLEKRTELLSEPIGIAVVMLGIVLLGFWAATALSVYQGVINRQ